MLWEEAKPAAEEDTNYGTSKAVGNGKRSIGENNNGTRILRRRTRRLVVKKDHKALLRI